MAGHGSKGCLKGCLAVFLALVVLSALITIVPVIGMIAFCAGMWFLTRRAWRQAADAHPDAPVVQSLLRISPGARKTMAALAYGILAILLASASVLGTPTSTSARVDTNSKVAATSKDSAKARAKTAKRPAGRHEGNGKKDKSDRQASGAAAKETGEGAGEKSDDDPGRRLVVRYLDVGQGDATMVEFPDGKTMVIDAGREGGQTVSSVLARDGRARIDWLVETHPDADHIGGLPDVIRANDIGSVWAPRCNHSTHAYTRFLEAVAAKNLQIDEAYAGRRIASGDGYAIDVTWPRQGATYSDSNDYSVVILVTYGQNTFLFTGDAPVEALEQCTTGHVDVLKASHHGSASGTDAPLAQRLTPKIAVLSYGLDNSYGHPAQTVLDALAATGTTVYGTGAQGTVTVSSDGHDLSVSTERQGTVQAQSTDAGAGSSSLDEGGTTGGQAPPAQTEAAQPQPSSPSGQEEVVYVAPSGTKYHAKGCRTLSRSKVVTSMPRSQAEAQGYTACKVCGG